MKRKYRILTNGFSFRIEIYVKFKRWFRQPEYKWITYSQHHTTIDEARDELKYLLFRDEVLSAEWKVVE